MRVGEEGVGGNYEGRSCCESRFFGIQHTVKNITVTKEEEIVCSIYGSGSGEDVRNSEERKTLESTGRV